MTPFLDRVIKSVIDSPDLQDLKQQKQVAIDREDYDEANRLKYLIKAEEEKHTATAEEIAQAEENERAKQAKLKDLEKRKKAAVANEDFEEASKLKKEMENLTTP